MLVDGLRYDDQGCDIPILRTAAARASCSLIPPATSHFPRRTMILKRVVGSAKTPFVSRAGLISTATVLTIRLTQSIEAALQLSQKIFKELPKLQKSSLER
jgi:hypothetical protein